MENNDFFDNEVESPVEKTAADSGVEIPVRVQEADRDIVAEYEERYYGKPKHSEPEKSLKIPPRYKRALRPAPASVTEEERMWAAAAHASAILTIGMLVLTAGIGSLVTLFIPLGIWAVYRHKSEFVANHALQAFAAQAFGTIGFVAILGAVVTVFFILTVIFGILSIILIGIPFLVVTVLLGIAAIAATLFIPLGALIYGMIGAVDAYEGRYFKYPWIGDMVDHQMYDL